MNGKVVTYQAYNHALEQHNILVKAKNFLVFQVRYRFDAYLTILTLTQGDVEAVASQSPKDLSRLIEQISGSLELAPEYERAKAQQDRATENATFNFTKRRGIAGEIKQFKEQKSEADRFEKLCAERVRNHIVEVCTFKYNLAVGCFGTAKTIVEVVPHRTEDRGKRESYQVAE